MARESPLSTDVPSKDWLDSSLRPFFLCCSPWTSYSSSGTSFSFSHRCDWTGGWSWRQEPSWTTGEKSSIGWLSFKEVCWSWGTSSCRWWRFRQMSSFPLTPILPSCGFSWEEQTQGLGNFGGGVGVSGDAAGVEVGAGVTLMGSDSLDGETWKRPTVTVVFGSVG